MSLYTYLYKRMEEIIQILIFVGAMVIAVVGKSAKDKKKPMVPSPEEVLEEMFPDTGNQHPEEAVPQVQPVRSSSFKQTPKKKRTSVVEPQQPPVYKETSKHTDKIRLNTRSEARKAFIHSEIFNRKY